MEGLGNNSSGYAIGFTGGDSVFALNINPIKKKTAASSGRPITIINQK
jgi:hypothetical protein